MSDRQPRSDPEPAPTHQNPYVIEHYGFAASAASVERDQLRAPAAPAPPGPDDPVGRPVRRSRRRVLAAGAMGLLLAIGIGGVAAATAATGPDGRGDGDRSSVSFVGRDGAGQRTRFDGPGGRR